MKPISDKQRLDWLNKHSVPVGPFFEKPPIKMISFFAVGAYGKCSVRQAIDRAILATEPKRGKK